MLYLFRYLDLGRNDAALMIDAHERAEDEVEAKPGGPEPFSASG